MAENPFPVARKLLRGNGWQSYFRPVGGSRLCVGIATDEALVRVDFQNSTGDRLLAAHDCLRATTNDDCDMITYHNDHHLPGPNAAHAWLRRAEAEWNRRHGSAT